MVIKSRYGLIGKGIDHSLSAPYFNEKFREMEIPAVYELYPLTHIGQLPGLITRIPDLKGLNVTSPYKQEVIPLLNKMSPDAETIGAVNVIKIDEGPEGSTILTGYNADWLGYFKTLENLALKEEDKALILGSGGASKAVAFALSRFGMNYDLASRNPGSNLISYQEASERLDEYKLIVNATPLGMPHSINEMPPLAFQKAHSQQIFYDLIYAPEETVFLKKAKEIGARIINGKEMLINQAEISWEIWQK